MAPGGSASAAVSIGRITHDFGDVGTRGDCRAGGDARDGCDRRSGAARGGRGGPTVTCSSDPSVFNTGYNAATAGKLGFGATDANWEVTARQEVLSGTSMPPPGVTWF